MSDLNFRLDLRAPEQRRILVSLEFDPTGLYPAPDATGSALAVELFLPTWTPGSYLIREYARHLGPVRAADAQTGESLQVEKTAKNRFRIRSPRPVQRLRVDYHVYAHELSVRTADVTHDHAYWNHACILLWPAGRKGLKAEVTALLPKGWTLFGGAPTQTSHGEARYQLADLDAAIDAPMLAGKLETFEVEARGKPHQVVLDGMAGARVVDSFRDDVKAVIETAADVFGGELPYERYTFLCLFTDRGYGGLEHADSTTLLASRSALAGGKDYKEFLGLLAHELFHAWNVKRMRPAELWDYDYEAENLTPMLWLAEGWTAYYDDLICRRCKRITVDEYLTIVGKNLTALWSGMGRFKQSLAEASFDAWIRFYRPDENTRNSTQNYYGNGALAATVLDLTIRQRTDGARCLDHAIAQLYRATFGQGRGYRLADVVECLNEAAGADLAPLLHALTQGSLDPDFVSLLAEFGVAVEPIERDRPYFGFALESGSTKVASVTDDSPAFLAGIAPGDEILGLAGLRATNDRWADLVRSTAMAGQPISVLLSSRGVIRELQVTPTEMPRHAVRLTLDPHANEAARRLRSGWLGADADAKG